MEIMIEQPKILIIDDDDSIIDILEFILVQEGYDVFATFSGEDAIDMVGTMVPDLILLDIEMPEGWDGYQTIQALHQVESIKNVPILFLSGHIDLASKKMGYALGAKDILQKPFQKDELLAKIKTNVELYKLQEQLINEVATKTSEIYRSHVILTAAPFVIIYTDANGLIEYVNPAVRNVFKYMEGEVEAEPLLKLLPGLEEKQYDSYTVSCNRGDLEILTDETKNTSVSQYNYLDRFIFGSSSRGAKEILQARTKQGDLIWIQVTINRELIQTDIVYSVIIHDITQQKLHELEVDQLNAELEERVKLRTTQLESSNIELKEAFNTIKETQNKLIVSQAKIMQQEKMASVGQLAAGVAHEINNPIGFVLSNLNSLHRYAEKITDFLDHQWVEEQELNYQSQPLLPNQTSPNQSLKSRMKAMKIDFILDDLCNIVDETVEGVDRVKDIVQNLRVFSGVDVSELKWVDINEGIQCTLNILKNEFSDKAISLQIDYGKEVLAKCCPQQLNQVFLSILVNAIAAVDEKGQILIKTWQTADAVFIVFSDNGCGIAQDNLNKIFEPFFSTKKVGQGYGLGLSMAHEIIKKHEGEILVESKVDKGTVMTIKLPYAAR